MRSESEIRAALRAWIVRASGKVEAEELTDATPIVERRILSSLQVPELLLYIETLRGAPVDVQQLRPGALGDIDAMYRVFFRGADNAR
jgi:hypothetical protein